MARLNKSLYILFASALWGATAVQAGGGPSSVSEIRLGVFDHDTSLSPHSGSLDADEHEKGAALNLEIVFQRLPFDWAKFIANPRPMIGVQVNTDGFTNFVYSGLAWNHTFPLRDSVGLFVEGSFGLAAHDGKLETPRDAQGFNYLDGRAALGSVILFRESVDIGFEFGGKHRITGHGSHMSNGGIFSKTNQGISFVGVRWGRVLGAPR